LIKWILVKRPPVPNYCFIFGIMNFGSLTYPEWKNKEKWS
jgi:hypothetical protein